MKKTDQKYKYGVDVNGAYYRLDASNDDKLPSRLKPATVAEYEKYMDTIANLGAVEVAAIAESAERKAKRNEENRLAFVDAMKSGDFETASRLIWK